MRYKIIPVNKLKVCDSNPGAKVKIRGSDDAIEVLKGFFCSVADDQERLVVLAMNNKAQVMSLQVVHVGGMSSSVVDRACVLRHVLVSGATSFVIAHNHPGGDPTPSSEDKMVAEILAKGALIVGVSLVDFIIIGDETGDSFSFKNNNLI
jgi:DNA repair protein RadC